MSAANQYRILDEPQPGALAKFAVAPVWPLFALMFAGTWMSWVWFAFNGYSIGSPTRRKEVALVVVGFIGTAVLALVFWALVSTNWISGRRAGFAALLIVTLWKLGVTYWLFELQHRSFELYRYFGGTLRSGIPFVLLGFLATPAVVGLMPSVLWRLLVT